MHKVKNYFFIIFAFLWMSQLGLATPHKSSSASHKVSVSKKIVSHKKTLHKTVKKQHKKTFQNKYSKVHNTKRIIKPHIVRKKDILSEKNLRAYSTETSKSRVAMPAKTSSGFYRILTQPMGATNAYQAPSYPPVEHKIGFAASIEQRLVNFVHKTVSSLRYSTYKLGGSKIDTTQGIYIVDCSGYVDHTLRVVYPNAYLSLVDSSGVNKPNTAHYYNFFTSLSDDPDQFWSKVEDIEQLRPGDILVFRYKNMRGRSTGGHVMVVMNKPVRDGDAYLVSVADSAASGHSEDTRQNHVSGVGIGTILLKVDPKTRQPSAYAWTVNSRWKNNVNFAMARPLGMDSWNARTNPIARS